MAFVSVGAILSIYWGWRLYTECIASRVSGELHSKSLRFKFTAASPGVLLAAFGAWLLSLVATHPFSLESSSSLQRPTSLSTRSERSVGAFAIENRSSFQMVVDTPRANAPQNPQKCDECILKKIVIKNMDGREVAPSATEIADAIDVSIAKLRADHNTSGSSRDNAVTALQTLTYLREAARTQADAIANGTATR